jgi:hypothetical protein
VGLHRLIEAARGHLVVVGRYVIARLYNFVSGIVVVWDRGTRVE